MLWQEWQQDYGPEPEVVQLDKNGVENREDVPVATLADGASAQTSDNKEISAVPVIAASASEIITVTTDFFSVEIDTKGGTLRNLDLLQYPKSSAQANEGWVKLLKEKFDIPWLA